MSAAALFDVLMMQAQALRGLEAAVNLLVAVVALRLALELIRFLRDCRREAGE